MCPLPRYGSFMMMTSPGLYTSVPSSSIIHSTVNLIVPICDGQNSAWAIIVPCLSNRTQEKSSDSLKMGEYAVRIIATPISRQVVAK